MGMRWVWGTVLILLGLGLLSNTLGIEGMHNFIVRWWPIIFIVFGLGELIVGEFLNGFFWLIVGVIIGLFTTGTVDYTGNLWSIIWSIVVILIGLRLILRPMMKVRSSDEKEKFVGTSAVFGGTTKKVSAKEFTGSNLTAVFGGAKLDLRNAMVAKEGAIIDVSAVFGGVEIIVPEKTPVRMNAVAIFGGQEDKRDTSKIDESLPIITISGEVIFGGIEVKS